MEGKSHLEPLRCTQCGGTLREEGGHFFCDYCGTEFITREDGSLVKEERIAADPSEMVSKPAEERSADAAEKQPRRSGTGKFVFITLILLAVLILIPRLTKDPEPAKEANKAEEPAASVEPELAVLTIEGIEQNTVDNEDASFTVFNGTTTSWEQIDIYPFTAPLDGRYRLEFSEIKGNGNVAIAVFDHLEKRLDYEYCGNGEGVTVDLTKGEGYEIRVGETSYQGPYTLTIGLPKPTVDLTGITAINDSIEYRDQLNNYTFTPPRDGRYRFEFAEIRENGSMKIAIYNRLGEEMEYEFDGNRGGITEELTEGETYTVKVAYGNRYSPYTLKIGTQKPSVSITGYDVIRDSIEFTDQVNQYLFAPPESGNYDFLFSDIEENGRIEITVYNRLGERIANQYDGNGGDLTVPLTEGEEYEIDVSYGNSFTPYAIQIMH